MTVEFGREMRSYYEYLVDKGAKQTTAAARLNISQSLFSQILSGGREPNPIVAETLVEILKVPLHRQARFLLLAAGHSEKMVERILASAHDQDHIIRDAKRAFVNRVR